MRTNSRQMSLVFVAIIMAHIEESEIVFDGI